MESFLGYLTFDGIDANVLAVHDAQSQACQSPSVSTAASPLQQRRMKAAGSAPALVIDCRSITSAIQPAAAATLAQSNNTNNAQAMPGSAINALTARRTSRCPLSPATEFAATLPSPTDDETVQALVEAGRSAFNESFSLSSARTSTAVRPGADDDSSSDNGNETEYHSPPNSLNCSTSDLFSVLPRTSRRARALAIASSVAREMAFLVSLGANQVQALTSGVLTAMTTQTRPTWDSRTQISLHWLRANLRFSNHAIHRVRWASKTASALGIFRGGPNVKELTLTIRRDGLLRYEAQGSQYRRGTKAWLYPVPPEDTTRVESANRVYSINGEWIHPPVGSVVSGSRPKRTILFIHGGAYIAGSTDIYRSLTTRIAMQTGCRVFAIDYRLAPENPFPASLHDAFAAYMYLTQPRNSDIFVQPSDPSTLHEPVDPADLIVMGDSAGGGLSMSLLNYLNLYLRKPDGTHSVPLPGGVVLISPWVDLSCSSESWHTNKALDWLPHTAANMHGEVGPNLRHPAYLYCLGEDTRRPLTVLSPTADMSPTALPLPSSTTRGPSAGRGHVRHDSGIDAEKLRKSLEQASPSSASGSATMSGTTASSTVSPASVGAAFPAKTGPAATQDAAANEAVLRDSMERFVRHPLVSPIFTDDMAGLPPILIQAGECEVLRDESVALAFKYLSQNKGSSTSWVRHEMYTDMVHVFQAMQWLPAAKLALKHMSQFFEEIDADASVPLETYRLTAEETRYVHMIDSHINM